MEFQIGFNFNNRTVKNIQTFTRKCKHFNNVVFFGYRDTVDGQQNRITEILSNFGYQANHYDADDLAVIQFVSALVSYRAAKLVSINTAILLNRMDERDITIAIDGSLYKHHPRMRNWLDDLIRERVPDKLVT